VKSIYRPRSLKPFAVPVIGTIEIDRQKDRQRDRLILFYVPKLHFAATVCRTNSYVRGDTDSTESWYDL